MAVEIEPADDPCRRRAPRAAVSLNGRIEAGGRGRSVCRISDLSMIGVRLHTYCALRQGATLRLTLPGLTPRLVDVVWATDFDAGCEFRKPLDHASFDRLVALDRG